MTSFDSSQVNIHAGQTGALSMVLAENERTSRQQQQNRWNDKKQFFHRQNLQFKYSVPSWDAKKSHGETRFPVGRAALPNIGAARASGQPWFAPLGCHTSAGWPLSRPSQCAHWLALRPMRQHRPALTADGQRSMFPVRGANLFNVRCGSYFVTGPAA